jgi:hypothetical protein
MEGVVEKWLFFFGDDNWQIGLSNVFCAKNIFLDPPNHKRGLIFLVHPHLPFYSIFTCFCEYCMAVGVYVNCIEIQTVHYFHPNNHINLRNLDMLCNLPISWILFLSSVNSNLCGTEYVNCRFWSWKFGIAYLWCIIFMVWVHTHLALLGLESWYFPPFQAF